MRSAIKNLDILGSYREQLDSLIKLQWPALTCRTVPWASHTRLCSLHSWTIGPPRKQTSSLPVTDTEQVQVSPEIEMDEDLMLQREM